jgi:hypothetical protein
MRRMGSRSVKVPKKRRKGECDLKNGSHDKGRSHMGDIEIGRKPKT